MLVSCESCQHIQHQFLPVVVGFFKGPHDSTRGHSLFNDDILT